MNSITDLVRSFGATLLNLMHGALCWWFNVKKLADIQKAENHRAAIIHSIPLLLLLSLQLNIVQYGLLGQSLLVTIEFWALFVGIAGSLLIRLLEPDWNNPGYLSVTGLCSVIVLITIYLGQGTTIHSHTYFILFAILTPVVVPSSKKVALCTQVLILVGLFALFETFPVKPDPRLEKLSPSFLHILRLLMHLHIAVAGVAMVMISEAASRDLRHKLLHQATTDALTGLPNRRAFDFALTTEFNARTKQHLCLALIDIDFFKRINDQYGHDAGDTALQHVSNLLKSGIRTTDLCARLGGEEFAILMRRTTLPDALSLLERLRENIERTPWQVGSQSVEITISIGIAKLNRGMLEKDLTEYADSAMYKAKNSGRNKVVVYAAET